MAKLSDAQAKAIMRDSKHWPTCTSKWGVQAKGHYWIRCQPSDTANSKSKLPYLRSPGANLFTTKPDGLWAYFNGVCSVDAIVIEVCGTIQNLNDKRSRYGNACSSLVLTTPVSWLNGQVRRQKGGLMLRHEACGTFRGVQLPTSGEVDVAVRFLRVLFAIPDDEYANWMKNNVPGGHEYFMRHSSLKTATSPDTQRFLAGMSFSSHFRTTR